MPNRWHEIGTMMLISSQRCIPNCQNRQQRVGTVMPIHSSTERPPKLIPRQTGKIARTGQTQRCRFIAPQRIRKGLLPKKLKFTKRTLTFNWFARNGAET